MKKFLVALLIVALVIGGLYGSGIMEKEPVYAGDLSKVKTMEELEKVFKDLLNPPGQGLFGLRSKTAMTMEAAVEMAASSDMGPGATADTAFDMVGEANAAAPAAVAESEQPQTSAVAESGAAVGGESASGNSETNVQVAGVDEADMIKTDGERIYIMSNRTVYIYDTNLKQLGKVMPEEDKDVEVFLNDMYVDGNLLILTGQRYIRENPPEIEIPVPVDPNLPVPLKEGDAEVDTADAQVSAEADTADADTADAQVSAAATETNTIAATDTEAKIAVDVAYMRPMRQLSEIYVYDVTNPAKPVKTVKYGTEGYAAQTRKVGDVLYLVTNYYPSSRETLVPLMTVPANGVKLEADEKLSTMPIESIEYHPGEKGTGYSTITALNTKTGEVKYKSVVHQTGEIYMNKSELFLAETFYNYEDFYIVKNGDTPATESKTRELEKTSINMTRLTRFAVDGLEIGEGKCGIVPGSPLNQFSMDSYDGAFRIATTSQDKEWNQTNNVFVIDNETMNVVGSITNMAEGEQIYSVRFMGDIVYVVTFETMDPLFVIDLSDKTAPKVTGELKIPGFSNYLHPIDETHLLGIGQDTQEVFVEDRNTGEKIVTGYRTNGMKLSLFDVKDMKNPVEQDVYYLGYNGTWSEVAHNHKALMCYGNLFGFDVDLVKAPDGGNFTKEAFLFEVTDKITPVAELPAKDYVYDEKDDYNTWFNGNRLCVAKDKLFYFSNNSLTSYNMKRFNEIGSVIVK